MYLITDPIQRTSNYRKQYHLSNGPYGFAWPAGRLGPAYKEAEYGIFKEVDGLVNLGDWDIGDGLGQGRGHED